MLDFELGDVTLWVQLNSRKPFPVCIYYKDKEWQFDAMTNNLTADEKILIQGFVRERIQEIEQLWGKNTRVHLNWNRKMKRR